MLTIASFGEIFKLVFQGVLAYGLAVLCIIAFIVAMVFLCIILPILMRERATKKKAAGLAAKARQMAREPIEDVRRRFEARGQADGQE